MNEEEEKKNKSALSNLVLQNQRYKMESKSSEGGESEIPVIIKKRAARPNQRRRDDSDDEKNPESTAHGDKQDDGIDREKMKDLKLLHQMRQRQGGISVDELIHGDKKASRNNQNSDDLKSILGNQFNSRMDYGFQQEVPHQKIMDEFIDKKLGLKKEVR